MSVTSIDLRLVDIAPVEDAAPVSDEEKGVDFSALVRARLYGEAMAASSSLRGMERLCGGALTEEGETLSRMYGTTAFSKVESIAPFKKTSFVFEELKSPRMAHCGLPDESASEKKLSKEQKKEVIRLEIQPHRSTWCSDGGSHSLPVREMEVIFRSHRFRTKDPLPYLVTHIDRIRDIVFCIKKEEKGACKAVPLPAPMRDDILEFIKKHRDISTWNCKNFTAATRGVYRGRECTKDGEGRCITEAASERKEDLRGIKIGDAIAFYNGSIESWHNAVYLGNGLTISKNGYRYGLVVTKLEEVVEGGYINDGAYHFWSKSGSTVKVLKP